MQNNENHTEGKKMIISKNDENSVQITANILKNNGIAILPTDTVYGFSASVNLSTDKKIMYNISVSGNWTDGKHVLSGGYSYEENSFCGIRGCAIY